MHDWPSPAGDEVGDHGLEAGVEVATQICRAVTGVSKSIQSIKFKFDTKETARNQASRVPYSFNS